jgi:hypothetical protein
MPHGAARSLPGIRFVSEPPPLREVLPRMDIAVFAGFAARGPIGTPVALEDAADFIPIFGSDAPLAWDPETETTTFAYLAPAVRAFFRNGGTRCWVVRVAGAASANAFPIPGVVRLSGGVITPAFAHASSPGRWSDDLRVGSAASVRPLDVAAVRALDDRLEIDVESAAGTTLVTGDLVRVRTARHVAFVPVDSVADGPPSSPPSERRSLTVTGRPVWFRTVGPTSGVAADLLATVYTARRDPSGPDETFASAARVAGCRIDDATADAELDLQLDVAAAPEPGALVSVGFGTEQLWLTVADVGLRASSPDAEGDIVVVRGRALWWLPAASASPPEPVTGGDCLRLELWVRETDVRTLRLSDLGFAPGHPRYWAGLPSDERRYEIADPPRPTGTDAALSEPGFPLAGAGPLRALYLPLDVTTDPARLLGAARQLQSPLERDGLATFDAALFVDRILVRCSTHNLLETAEHLRFLARSPRRPAGVHAALDIEEATLLSAPDVCHRGWRRAPQDPVAPPQTSAPLARPEWWHSLACNPPQPVPQSATPPFGQFLDCGIRVLEPPQRLRRLDGDDGGTYTLAWESREQADFVLEEARATDFADAAVIYTGTDRRLAIYGRSDGTYYYRVRARIGTQSSDWSEGLAVRVARAAGWNVVPPGEFSADTLVAVQRALLRIAAARGDLFAVLAMPSHFREVEALAYTHALETIGPGESRTSSFGAVYHPWLSIPDPAIEASVRVLPPDGTLTGLIAGRARLRGAWIAPANEPLKGVVALSPALARARRSELAAARINLISQEPRGFLTLGADTLSDEEDLAPIGVRRLLSLLRRLALREGVTYVFEPHSESFRRLVQRGFESFLSHMFERGAFAGRTADKAFRVVTSSELNTAQSTDQGRFIVELRVAPALPMTFLTVRLVQSGDRTLLVEER